MDRTRRVRMQLVIRNFLQRAFKGAFPKMETYSYFRGSDDHGETCLSIPAMGLILATRQDKRPMEASICATQSGVILNESLRLRMEYSFSYANKSRERRQIRFGQINAQYDSNRERGRSLCCWRDVSKCN